MKYLLIFFMVLLFSCSPVKKVYICGDHQCINKKEAKQYFEDNLSLEIQIHNKKDVNSFSLVQLNTAHSNDINNKKKKKVFNIKKLNKNEKKKSDKKIKEIKKTKKIS